MEVRRKCSKEDSGMMFSPKTPGPKGPGWTSHQEREAIKKDFVFRYDDHCFSISAHAAEVGSMAAASFKQLPRRKQKSWLPKWKFPEECLSGKQPARTVGESVKFRVGTDKSKPFVTGTVEKITKFGVPLRCKSNEAPPEEEA